MNGTQLFKDWWSSTGWGTLTNIIMEGLSNTSANKFNADQAEKNRQFQSEEAQKTREWQTEMSNTSYQRMVEDLTKAGLSPMMALSRSGASTPSGANASGAMATGNKMKGMERLLNTAQERKNMKEQNKVMKSNIKVNEAAEAAKRAEERVLDQKAIAEAYDNQVREINSINWRTEALKRKKQLELDIKYMGLEKVLGIGQSGARVLPNIILPMGKFK